MSPNKKRIFLVLQIRILKAKIENLSENHIFKVVPLIRFLTGYDIDFLPLTIRSRTAKNTLILRLLDPRLKF